MPDAPRQPPRRPSAVQYRRGFLKYRSALHDRVTDLPVVAALVDRLRTELDVRRRLGVVTVETVHLDTVESLYGWQVVDRVLERLSFVLREAIGAELPAESALALNRRAGDRFVAFVFQRPDGDDVDPAFLAEAAQRLSRRLERARDEEAFRGLNPALEFRCGHATLAPDPFHRFERRVYAAVDEAVRSNLRRRERRELAWAEELQRIIRDCALETVVQPVVELATRDVYGYEALVRGPRASLFELPGSMFDLSARMGLDLDLDRACRETALRACRGRLDGRALFLNVLPGALEQAAEALVAGRFDGGGAEPRGLVVEVTERGDRLDDERAVAAVDALRRAGIRVALDDAGTGPDTRRVVERLRPDFLKLDLSLVRDIQKNPLKREVLTTLIALAREIDAEVVAEGIESEAEAETLAETGARYGQGYLFAVPSPVDSPLWGLSRGHPGH